METTIERVSIHVHYTNQDTTARMELTSIKNTNSYIAILFDIPNLKPFNGMSDVTVKLPHAEIRDVFYWGGFVGNLIQMYSRGLDFWKITDKGKESEDNKMKHKVTITKTEQKTLEEYWCMRAIKAKALSNTKTVVKEKECIKEPTLEEIAIFLAESGGDFVSVAHNYRFEPELPFD